MHLRVIYPVLSFVVLIGITAFLAAKVSGQSVDDVFITYRYAQNLVAGNGFVFNPGEWVLATTAPAWGPRLAALHGVTRVGLENLRTWHFGFCLAAGEVLGLFGQRLCSSDCLLF